MRRRGSGQKERWLTCALAFRLMKEAGIEAKRSGERGVSSRSVRKVRERCLRGWKG